MHARKTWHVERRWICHLSHVSKQLLLGSNRAGALSCASFFFQYIPFSSSLINLFFFLFLLLLFLLLLLLFSPLLLYILSRLRARRAHQDVPPTWAPCHARYVQLVGLVMVSAVVYACLVRFKKGWSRHRAKNVPKEKFQSVLVPPRAPCATTV